MKKSIGHICFNGDFEYYAQAGEVFKAPITNAFDIEGRRHGRWECSHNHFQNFRELYEPKQER